MEHSGNQEAGKLVLNAITALPPENLDLLVQKPPTFSMCAEIKNCRYLKPDIRAVKAVYGKSWILEICLA
jgi:hypothetical protein